MGDGVGDIRRNLHQRLQNEAALRVSGMRYRKLVSANDTISEQNDIDVERPRAVRRRPLPGVALFHRQAGTHQVFGSERGFDFRDGIQKPRLRQIPLRLGGIHRGAPDDAHSTPPEFGKPLAEVGFAVSEVGPESQERTDHDDI